MKATGTKSGIACLFFLALSPIGHSQVHLRFGLEGGYSFSDDPENNGDGNVYAGYYLNRQRKFVSSPVIGFTSDVTFQEHLSVLTGIHYQKEGATLFTYNRIIDNTPSRNTMTYERDFQEFHKLCVPVGVGVLINAWNVRIMLMGGIRINHIMGGRMYHERELHYPLLNTFYNYEEEYNLQSRGKESRTDNNQLFFGLSALFFEKVRVSYTVNKGGSIRTPYASWGYAWFGFPNNDYILSVAYLLKQAPEYKRIYHRTGYKTVRYL